MRHCSAIEPAVGRIIEEVVVAREVEGANSDELILRVEYAEGHGQVAGGQPLLGPLAGDFVVPAHREGSNLEVTQYKQEVVPSGQKGEAKECAKLG